MVDIVSASRAATDLILVVVNAGLIAVAVLVSVRYSPGLRAPKPPVGDPVHTGPAPSAE